MHIWGITKKYSTFSWWENHMGGHISIGPVTIFGANAMCWVVNISTRWGYLCFTLPVKARWKTNSSGQKWYQWYIYLSPNGTPWASTFYRGSDKNEKIRAHIRKMNFGHGFKSYNLSDSLHALNNKYASFHISEWEVEEYVEKNKDR